MPDRRAFLSGAAAAAVAAVCRVPAVAHPLTFDPAAFLADLLDAGVEVWFCRPPHVFGRREPPYYVLQMPEDRTDDTYGKVMTKWGPARRACPDHVARMMSYAASIGY